MKQTALWIGLYRYPIDKCYIRALKVHIEFEFYKLLRITFSPAGRYVSPGIYALNS